MKKPRNVMLGIGLMSGTSADGVDVALVRFSGPRSRLKLELEKFRTYAIPNLLRESIHHAFNPATSGVDRLCQLNVDLGEFYARCVLRFLRDTGTPAESVDFIASHGQTIYHIPRIDQKRGWQTRSTLQLGEPSIIAERTGMTTVADFRPRDMAAGGQGAPLVPLLDAVLYGKRGEGRVLLNIGGIANVTFLHADGNQIVAFDTGPGNMVIDGIITAITNGRHRCDRNGTMAASGSIHETLLRELLRHPYFRKHPPKTTGREDFGEVYTRQLLQRAITRGIRDKDLMATATALTVHSITQAMTKFLIPLGAIHRTIVSGGGAKNGELMNQLQKSLPQGIMEPAGVFGIPPEAKEAVAFALLGYYTLKGWPNNIPAATGAQREVVMGKIIPGR